MRCRRRPSRRPAIGPKATLADCPARTARTDRGSRRLPPKAIAVASLAWSTACFAAISARPATCASADTSTLSTLAVSRASGGVLRQVHRSTRAHVEAETWSLRRDRRGDRSRYGVERDRKRVLRGCGVERRGPDHDRLDVLESITDRSGQAQREGCRIHAVRRAHEQFVAGRSPKPSQGVSSAGPSRALTRRT